MTTLSDLNIRLNETLKKSETRNLTVDQRERALNDALLFDVKNFRPWSNLVKKIFTQAVDGIMRIPTDFRKARQLFYGTDQTTSWEEYVFTDQNNFINNIRNTATITDNNGTQVIKVYDTDDRGADEYNSTSSLDLGLFDDAARERLFQTFTTETTSFKGAILKLKKVGTITTPQTITCSLYAATLNLPTGSALATATINSDEITSGYEYFYFSIPYTTTVDAQYSLVLSTDAVAADATNYIAWEYAGASQLTDGTRGIFDGTTYTAETGDMNFYTYSEVFTFYYEYKLTEMTQSTSVTGLSSEFDEAITMLAAARLLERQSGGSDNSKINMARQFRYGLAGSKERPEPDSAYGKLLTLWDENRTPDRNPRRRMTNIYERSSTQTTSKQHQDLSYLNYITRGY